MESVGIRKVIAERQLEGAIIYLSDKVDALEAQVQSMLDVLSRPTEEPKKEEEY